MKKVLSLLIVAVMITSMFSAVTVFADGNTIVVDGVVFSEDMKILVEYPWHKTDKSYTIPDSVETIRGAAFERCMSLISVVIPEGVTSIGGSAFSGCHSLTSVVIPEGVTSIGGYAFYGCNSLTSVTIPGSVTSIGDYAFKDCKSLESGEIQEGVSSIGMEAFYGCESLESVAIPRSVTSIGGYAFSGCRSLTSVVISGGLTRIEKGVFSSCGALESITIPESVTLIDEDAFIYCKSLTDVYYGATEYEWNSIEMFNSNAKDYLKNANIHFGDPDKSEIKVVVNGKRIKFDQPPVIENGRTLVPLRAIFEAIDNGSVSWDSATQTVRAARYDAYIELQIGSSEMKVNDEIKYLDVPAKTINGRTMVPARAVAEALGCNVSWDAENNAVIIN